MAEHDEKEKFMKDGNRNTIPCHRYSNAIEWRIIAKILDRFFLIIFPIATVAVFTIFITVGIQRMNESE